MYPNLLRHKASYLLCLLLCTFIDAYAQRAKDLISERPVPFTPGGYLDTVVDLYGKKVSLGQIAIDRHVRSEAEGYTMSAMMASSCSSGYFQMYLEPGCGMDGSDAASVARLNVLCRVLYDISNLINSPCSSTGQKVNIWVRSGLSGSAAGVATPFFNLANSITASGIADNTIWITLNSGRDAFTNVASPLSTSGGGSSGSTFFHGSVAFNFSGSVNWHTNLSTPPAPGTVDLYTVALHEMMHALGFSSVIDYNGNSVFGTTYKYYSRYDTHLQALGGAPVLVTSTPAPGCSMYNWDINPALLPISNFFSPGGTGVCPAGYQTGGSVDHTICANKLEYTGSWPVNMPVYTPECFEKGSSLSHFEDECYVPSAFMSGTAGPATNNQYFLMSNSAPPGSYSAATNPGVMKRYPTPEERQVLCDIGYSVNTAYGDVANLNDISYAGASCPGLGIVGINDGISPGGIYTYTTTGPSVNINPASAPLLANDYGVSGGSFKCLEVVAGGGSVSVTSGAASTTVLFTPAPGFGGVQLLRYIPVSATGIEGNITYVYVYVVDGSCLPTACDFVCNGSFESAVSTAVGSFSGLSCWERYAESPDLYTRGCTIPSFCCCFPFSSAASSSVHPVDTIGNNHYVGVGGAYNAVDSVFTAEAFQGRLSSSLIYGQNYRVSFWSKYRSGSIFAASMPVQFAVSPVTPLMGYSTVIDTFPPGLSPLCDFAVTHPDDAWHYYHTNITYLGPPGARTLVVMPAPWLDTPSGGAYLFFDDISIVPTAVSGSFYLPDTITYCHLLDLDSFVSIPGGTFSWYADSAGYIVNSHDHLFDPTAAYNASTMAGNNGIVVVCYKYTTALGCVQEVCDEIYINYASGPITGVPFACIGIPTSLSHITPGGTWTSSDTSVATIGASGVMVGVASGTSRISYQLPSGCFVTRVVTVNVSPSPILPTTPSIVCAGRSLALSNVIPSGTWTSSNTSIAALYWSGSVYGVSPGTCTITYTVSSGCFVVKPVTVNLSPSAITPSPLMCIGTSVTLTNTVPGGTWTSTNALVAPVNPVTGVVNGSAVGWSVISYTIPNGCYQLANAVVNPYPTAITPAPVPICVGDTFALHTTPLIGSWSSSDTLIAKIDTGGVVTGMGSGTCNITYNIPPNCFAVTTVTVKLSPSAIVPAVLGICVGNTTTLLNTVSGGVWASTIPSAASVGASSGLLTGVSPGTTIVSYTIPSTGCYATAHVTVNSSPLPIAPAADTFVCVGNAIMLSDASPGGTWSSSSTSTAIVSPSGVVTGMGAGTVNIFYILPSGCHAMKTVTVNPALSAIAPGMPSVCMGSSLTLSNTISGGTWISSNTAVGTVGSGSGIVTPVAPGTTTVTYNAAGCQVTTIVTVNPNPAPITPSPVSICVGSVMTLSDATPGGTWLSSNAAIATVTSGGVHGFGLGACRITYTLPTGCYDTVLVTVNPPLPPITPAAPIICSGATLTLSHPDAGGTWSSTDITIATVSATTGVVSSVTYGTALISYAVGYCAATTIITVNSSPISPLSPAVVCVGATLGLTAMPPGGTWISSSPFVASVGGSGAVSALVPGVTMITYTTSSGCFASKEVTVNEAPAAMAPVSLCAGNMLHLTNSVVGGSWISANTAIASVGSSTGWISGVAAGITVIDYILPNGCYETVSVTVDPLPISGTLTVNVGSTTTLTNPGSAGSWYSANPAIATVGSTSGIVTGVAPGTAIINYSLVTGCKVSAIVTVSATTASEEGRGGFASLSVVPNPNEGTFTLAGVFPGELEDANVEIQVLDVVGRVVMTEYAVQKQGRLNTKLTIGNNLANGQYMIKVKASGATQVLRFVLER